MGILSLRKAEGEIDETPSEEKSAQKTNKGVNRRSLALKKNVKTGMLHFGLGLSIAPVILRTDLPD